MHYLELSLQHLSLLPPCHPCARVLSIPNPVHYTLDHYLAVFWCALWSCALTVLFRLFACLALGLLSGGALWSCFLVLLSRRALWSRSLVVLSGLALWLCSLVVLSGRALWSCGGALL